MIVLFIGATEILVSLVILGIPFFLLVRLLWALIKKLEK